MHKGELIETLLHISFRLCSNYEKFHREIETLKSMLKHNNYPQNFVNQCIKNFLNKLFIIKDLNFIVPKRELTFVLPYLGKILLDLRTRLRRTIERDLRYCKLKIIFRSKCRLKHTVLDLEICLRKKFTLEKFIVICVVTARLLIMGKPSATFIPEQLNTWGFPILQGNVSKTLNSLQYLTIYWSVIVP